MVSIRFHTSTYVLFQRESPSSGKFTALGVYSLACLFFVVADFVQFAFSLYFFQYNERKRNARPKSTPRKKPILKMRRTLKRDKKSSSCDVNDLFNVIQIDRASSVVAILLFSLFNLIYWSAYLFLDTY